MDHISKRITDYLDKNQPGLLATWRKTIRPCDGCGREYESYVRTVQGQEIVSNNFCNECHDKRMQENERNRALQELNEITPGIRTRWLDNCWTDEEKWETKTFDNFESNRQPKAFAIMKEYSGRSIVLFSPDVYGLGKTHLVAALINNLISTSEVASITPEFSVQINGCPAYFVTENKILARIRATYDRQRGDGSETEEQVYRSVERVPLLVIDDVGKVQPNDLKFLQSVYFRIIDYKYSNDKPVILTTNLNLDNLERHIGGACADRLREMCGKDGFIKMGGTSYRKK